MRTLLQGGSGALKKRGIQLLNLRNLTRQHDSLTGMYVQTKLQFQAVLDQVFPEYEDVFGDLYSAVSLLTLLEFPTSKEVLGVEEKILANRIDELCKNRSTKWTSTQAKRLIDAAYRNPFKEILYQSHITSLEMNIKMLLEYQKHLSKLEAEIDALARDLEEYQLIQSIPGIGEKIAASIISEIGEIERFNHPKKLVAFAGIDPSIFESGRFKGTVNRITTEAQAGSDTRYIWPLNVPFEIHGRRKQHLKSSHVIRKCGG